WLFLNHSCRPTTAVRGRELIALRPIAPYEELSFDYETTEWHMAEPFTCRCGNCGGRSVRGFAFLPAEERERRRPYLAPHLVARIGVCEAQMAAV
ncbi:MAG: SET domain-containing protein-lysine N-methyltransferase, partial [Planctomycetia bacterium]